MCMLRAMCTSAVPRLYNLDSPSSIMSRWLDCSGAYSIERCVHSSEGSHEAGSAARLYHRIEVPAGSIRSTVPLIRCARAVASTSTCTSVATGSGTNTGTLTGAAPDQGGSGGSWLNHV